MLIKSPVRSLTRSSLDLSTLKSSYETFYNLLEPISVVRVSDTPGLNSVKNVGYLFNSQFRCFSSTISNLVLSFKNGRIRMGSRVE